MKWLPRRRVNLKKNPEVEETRQQLQEVRSKWPEIHELVGRLAQMNEENHYSQVILRAMQGGGQ